MVLACSRTALCLLIPAAIISAQTLPVQVGEYDLKALHLFHFTQFVEWPDSAFPKPDSPYIIGVLGENPFGNSLDLVLKGERVHGRPLLARYGQSMEDIGDCHIIFIPRKSSRLLPEVLRSVKGKSVLVVGDEESTSKLGGMINLIAAGNKLRVRVNVDAAKAERLTISSKLLRWAEIVGAQTP